MDRQHIKAAYPVQTMIGMAASVADGDRFTLVDAEKKPHRIRLEGIDSPESSQACGTESRKALANGIFGKQVTVEWKDKDQHGQILGHVIADDQWVNQKQVADGWAWHFKKYNKSSVLAAAEVDAHKAKLGLRADKEPVPAWEFRNLPAEKRPPLAAVAARASAIASTAEAAAPEIMIFVTKNGDKYHRENCQYLRTSKHAIPLSQAVKSYEPCSKCHPPTE